MQSQKYTLRAMARNYSRGHCWDHLDADVVTKAANEINQLEEKLYRARVLFDSILDDPRLVVSMSSDLLVPIKEFLADN